MERSTMLFMGKSTISMVIFRYLKLPEGTHILGNLHLEPLCVFIFRDKWLTCDPVAKKKYRSCRTCIRSGHRVQNGWPGDHYCPPERRFTTYPFRVAQQNAATLVCRKRRVWMPKMDENGPKLHIFSMTGLGLTSPTFWVYFSWVDWWKDISS